MDSQFEQTTVDRIFIAVTKNTDQELRGILPEKDMSRMHFYEALVRTAYYKYKQGGAKATPFEAVKHFVCAVLKPNFDVSMWADWRLRELYTLEVDDLYKSNLVPMKGLYRYYFQTKKTKTFYFDDAQELFGVEAELGVHPEVIG